MTLTDKPLSELEALRDRQASELAETEAAIAAKVVDPLQIEAREVCAKWCDEREAPSSAATYRRGEWDDASHMAIALAALKRGMELQRLAPAEPVDEVSFMDAVWDALKADANDLRKQQRILKAFRATLARCAQALAEIGGEHG